MSTTSSAISSTVSKKQTTSEFDFFDLVDTDAYQQWREIKLASYPAKKEDLIVNIDTLKSTTDAERNQIIDRCDRFNMAIYQSSDEKVSTTDIRLFARNFGLQSLDHHRCTEEDGVSELTISAEGPKEEFIPYTNRPIGWHTDGYYNQAENRVYSLILHCVQPAKEGGVNQLLDAEIAYILIRDENPEYIKSLMAENCMTIPGYHVDEGISRPSCTGPVFLIEPISGKLHMRYTARKRNIHWLDDTLTAKATAFLTEMFSCNSQYIFTHKLEAGQGLIANNVLHNRTGFEDVPESSRLLYRARYLDRITNITL